MPQDDPLSYTVSNGAASEYDTALHDLFGTSPSSAPSSNKLKGKRKVSFNDQQEEFTYIGQDLPEQERISDSLQGSGEAYDEQMEAILGQEVKPELSEVPNGALQEHMPDTRINGAHVKRPDVDVFRDAPSAGSNHSNDEPLASGSARPGMTASPSNNSIQSLGMGLNRPAHIHPQIHRLRSSQRYPSISSIDSFQTGADLRKLGGSPASSKFDALSRQSSHSNIHELDQSTPPSSVHQAEALASSFSSFRWTPLRRISGSVFSGKSATMGQPTVLAASGIICIGTAKGWVMVFDYAQTLKCVCGNDAIVKDSGAVTALAISQDHTFIAVGHATGYIHLYALAQPLKPARSVPPTRLTQIQSGRIEGHLVGSKIRHLGFVGARHTAIISSDDRGLAFYHSLGQVLGLANTDILLILGRYPDSEDTPPPELPSLAPDLPESLLASEPKAQKQQPVIFDMAPLPLGPNQHSTDAFNLVVLITSAKLIIAGLKPKPRTWWRALYKDQKEDGIELAVGSCAWYPSTLVDGKECDPVLAFSWGKTVRLVEVSVEKVIGAKEKEARQPVFSEKSRWVTEGSIVRIQWLSQRILAIQTVSHIDLWDVVSMLRTGRAPLDLRTITNPDTLLDSAAQQRNEDTGGSILSAYNVRSYKSKVFVLAMADVRVATSLSWADRILALVNSSNLLEAIDLTTLYYQGQANATTLGLPADDEGRHQLVEPKLREIIQASIIYVFSPQRMQDGTHDDPEGRGVDRTSLFEGLVDACMRASTATGSFETVYYELYERYDEEGILPIYLRRISQAVLSNSVQSPPTLVVQRIIALHEQQDAFERIEEIIWRVDPQCLDINQVIKLCTDRKRWDPLLYVYTLTLHDWVSPLAILLEMVARVESSRATRSKVVGDQVNGQDNLEAESLVPDAYKIFTFLSNSFSGLSHPKQTPLSHTAEQEASQQCYRFIFSKTELPVPSTGQILSLKAPDAASTADYPYLRLLLRFDAEAALDCFDSAFEESYLNQKHPKTTSRQKIVESLLKVQDEAACELTQGDQTFVNIFVARNLPKYPQFLKLPEEIVHTILTRLLHDPDLSTRADRELATEFLFSVYTPQSMSNLFPELEQAGFYRILRSLYRSLGQWADLSRICLSDPDMGEDVFQHLDQVLTASRGKKGLPDTEAANVILASVLQLVEVNLFRTVELVERFLPSRHKEAIDRLAEVKARQFAYLRCLLEPQTYAESPAWHYRSRDHPDLQRLYIRLLCQFDRPAVVQYLGMGESVIEDQIIADCEAEGAYEAVIWSMDRNGQTQQAFEKLEAVLDQQSDILIHAALSHEDTNQYDFENEIYRHLDQLNASTRVGINICVLRSHQANFKGVEQLWYQLFGSCIAVSRDVSSRLKDSAKAQPEAEVEDDASMIELKQGWRADIDKTMQNLIQEALAALVSSTDSRTVSFPRLMKRLLDNNSSGTFNHLRPIITGMISTYKSEGEVLSVAEQLIDQDLYAQVEKLSKEKAKGWRPASKKCSGCNGELWGGSMVSDIPGASEHFGQPSVADLFAKLAPPRHRPKMNRKASLKGKETDWPESAQDLPKAQVKGGLQAIVTLRSGEIMHKSCYEARASAMYV